MTRSQRILADVNNVLNCSVVKGLLPLGKRELGKSNQRPPWASRIVASVIVVEDRFGPFMLVGARSFGRIAAMRLTAARSPNHTHSVTWPMSVFLVASKNSGQKCDLPMDRLIEFSA